MRIEMLDATDSVVGVVNGVKNEDEAARHMPFYGGAVAWREVDPSIVAAEESVSLAEAQAGTAIRYSLLDQILDLENRLRALELRQPIDREAYIAGLRKE